MEQLISLLTLLAVGTLNTTTPAKPALPTTVQATSYRAVDFTLKTTQSDGQISASATASPVLGVKNPPVKNGVAFVGMTRTQGSYRAVLGTRLPVNLHLDLTQGELQGTLASVPLSGLSLKSNQTDVNLTLPALNLNASMNTIQGDVHFLVPANVGVQFNLKKWNMGSLTINGEKVVNTTQASGSYATANYDSAKFKIQFEVSSDMTDISLTQK